MASGKIKSPITYIAKTHISRTTSSEGAISTGISKPILAVKITSHPDAFFVMRSDTYGYVYKYDFKTLYTDTDVELDIWYSNV